MSPNVNWEIIQPHLADLEPPFVSVRWPHLKHLQVLQKPEQKASLSAIMLTTNCISTVHCEPRCCAALMALEYKVKVHGSPLWSPVASSIHTQLLHFLCLHATPSQRWRNVTVRHAATMQTRSMDLSTPLKWQITLVEFVAFTVIIICSRERRKQVTSLECQLIFFTSSHSSHRSSQTCGHRKQNRGKNVTVCGCLHNPRWNTLNIQSVLLKQLFKTSKTPLLIYLRLRMLVWIISAIVVDNAHIFQGHISRVLLKGMFPVCHCKDSQRKERG